MKFQVNTKTIADAIKKAQTAVTNRSTLPILSCLKIESDDGGLKITGTNLDHWITVKVPATIEKYGSFCMSASILSRIMTGDAIAEFEIDAKHKAAIKIESSKFKISCLPASEFPENNAKPGADAFFIEGTEWLRATGDVKFCSSTEETRYALCGIYAEFDSGLNFIATNGNCLARTKVEFSGNESESVIIPSTAIPIIDVIANGEVEFRIGDGSIHASSAEGFVSCKLIQSNYPNYKAVVPNAKDFKTRAKIESKPFVQAIDRANSINPDNLAGTRFDFRCDSVLVSIKGEDEASSQIECDIDGDPLEIAWRAVYIRLPFRVWGADSLDVAMIDQLSPTLVTHAKNEFVIMPMRF